MLYETSSSHWLILQIHQQRSKLLDWSPSAPALRPAHLLTSAAIPGRLAALAIGIINPNAAHAGDDCCQAMLARKRGGFQPYLHELAVRQGINYRPMIWSASRHAHPETDTVLTTLGRRATCRKGLKDHSLILRRRRAAVWGRACAVRMVLSKVKSAWCPASCRQSVSRRNMRE